jgi:hypothetical protein
MKFNHLRGFNFFHAKNLKNQVIVLIAHSFKACNDVHNFKVNRDVENFKVSSRVRKIIQG